MWIKNQRRKVTSRYSPSMPEANFSLPCQHFIVYIESTTYAKHQMHSSYIFQNNKENSWKKSSVIIAKSIKWTWVSYIIPIILKQSSPLTKGSLFKNWGHNIFIHICIGWLFLMFQFNHNKSAPNLKDI